MEKGSIVKFKEGLYPDEEGQIYVVVEDNGDRCIIEAIAPELSLPPQSVAKTSELEKIG